MNRPAIQDRQQGGASVIMGYAVPARSRPKLKRRPRKTTRRRKYVFPGFRIRMMDFYRVRVRAAAECFGADIQQFCAMALLDAVESVCRKTGISRDLMLEMSKADRKSFSKRWWSVNLCLGRTKQLRNSEKC